MKRTHLKVRINDGKTNLTRTVYEHNGAHYVKLDGDFCKIYKTENNTHRVAWWYGLVEYIAE